MRQIFKYIAWIVIASCVVSCSGIPDMVEVMVEEVTSDENSVSLNVVDRYITAVKGLSRTRADQSEITPVLNEGDTVMYLVNYPEGGWELLSADKRVPTRLMVGEDGSMSLSEIEEHPGMSILLEEMRQKISAVKRSSQEEPVTEKGILWDDIAPKPEKTRSSSVTWIQIGQETVEEDEIFVDHLISTHWAQSGDENRFYNKYVPYVNEISLNSLPSTYNHCPVGCVPVAAGQVAAYLNKKFGFTTSCRFLQLNCQTYLSEIGSTTSYGPFVPATSTYVSDNNLYWRWVRGETWPQENIDNAVAVLLAFLGWKLDATYGFYQTGGTIEEIPFVFRSEYGVDCEHVEWNPFQAISQIVDARLPVIIKSGSALDHSDTAHAWIVDGYYEHVELINYYYQGFDTSNPSTPLYKTIQLLHTDEYFLMNWGFGGDGDDGTYYVDSSAWEVDGYTYNGSKMMVYNFSKM